MGKTTEKKVFKLSELLKAHFEKTHFSVFNYATKANIATATLNTRLKNYTFQLKHIEALGTFDEEVLNITINHLISLKQTPHETNRTESQQTINDLQNQLGKVQQTLIETQHQLINCQQQIINDKK